MSDESDDDFKMSDESDDDFVPKSGKTLNLSEYY